MASEDYCPWPIIASLALYKMYEQWQQQGYVMPKVSKFVNYLLRSFKEAAAREGGMSYYLNLHKMLDMKY